MAALGRSNGTILVNLITASLRPQRARPSLEDRLESGGLLCGRDALAGGTVLALQVSKGTLCALTNCRTTVKWPQQERISRGHLVESLANHWSTTDGRDGRGRLEGFIKDKKLDPFHVLVGNIFQESPEMHYVWKAPFEETPETVPHSCRWASGGSVWKHGIFVISNENPSYGETWPKCQWLQQELKNFLETLPSTASASDLHAGLASLMSRYDVPKVMPPQRLPNWFPASIEKMLHSGPFCPWRPELQHFGTVSQRILFNQGRVTHYYHRSTNLPSDTRDTRDTLGAAAPCAPALGEWQEFQISWDQSEQVVHPKL